VKQGSADDAERSSTYSATVADEEGHFSPIPTSRGVPRTGARLGRRESMLDRRARSLDRGDPAGAGSADSVYRISSVSLLPVRCPTREGDEKDLPMSRTMGDGRAGLPGWAVTQNDGLIARAAKRAGWAGAALEGAAGDLRDAYDDEGKAMTGLAEAVSDEAARMSRLAEDIESHRASHRVVPCGTTRSAEGGGGPRWRR
jgi:hypothetical protein